MALILLRQEGNAEGRKPPSLAYLSRRYFGISADMAPKYIHIARHYSNDELRSCRLGVTALCALAEVNRMHRRLIIQFAHEGTRVADVLRAVHEAQGIASHDEAKGVITAVLAPRPEPKTRPPRRGARRSAADREEIRFDILGADGAGA